MKKIWQFLLKLLTPKKEVIAPKEPITENKPDPITKPIPVSSETPWMTIADKEIGVKEFIGSAKNPRIAEYHKATTYTQGTEDDAWCSSFVCWALEQAGYKSTNSARAKSYLDYGIKLDKPKYGCIVVYDRGGGKGHVHFYVSDDESNINGLGGNQNNEVCYKAYARKNALRYVWPTI